MSETPNPLLGQILIEKGIISEDQLKTALHKQKETGGLLGAILIELGFIDQEAVFMPLVAGQSDIEYVNIKDITINQDVIGKIPAQFANHYKVIPIEFKNDTLTIATTKPLDIHMLDELGIVVPSRVNPVLANEKDIDDAIRKYYGVGAVTIEKMMDNASPELNASNIEKIDMIDEQDSDVSISKFLNQILFQAYRDRATDIHIEPFEDELQIRYRVDGILYDAKVPSNIVHFKEAINSRIKILSNLNIAEKRLPQDGRFKVRFNQGELDLRVSFLPTPYGESVVLRLLNTSRLFSLNELGLFKEEQTILEGLIKKPHGIIFLTGPTGSGKTTTLYSCLSEINTEEKKIVTIEDPIEYQLKGITQIQINPAIGLTFAQGLRSMLRHDPDVMMVGEVRDIETADIAIQVALTGHLVFSTLHTNDAASGVTRLLDMGVEPYLITSTIESFIAQRLIRILCPQCKEVISDKKELIEEFKGQVEIKEEDVIYKTTGCEACKMTGYQGRESIYEFLLINDAIADLIMNRASGTQIKDEAVKGGMKTLSDIGWLKVKEGITTPEEVIRVTQEEAD